MGKVDHPRQHQWAIKGDVVTDRRRGMIYAFERTEKCDYCELYRKSIWTLRPTYTRSVFSYKGHHIPMEDRHSIESTLETQIFETTTNQEVKHALIQKMLGKIK